LHGVQEVESSNLSSPTIFPVRYSVTALLRGRFGRPAKCGV
jgi:hypothetical protein